MSDFLLVVGVSAIVMWIAWVTVKLSNIMADADLYCDRCGERFLILHDKCRREVCEDQ